MKDKEKQTKVFDILDKMEFFQGQRAGRELWNDKPKEVQDKDIADFIKDINYIRSYLQDSVVLSREEYEMLQEKVVDLRHDKFDLKNEISEKDNKIALLEETIDCIKFNVDSARKETAEKILFKFESAFAYYDNDDMFSKKAIFECLEEIVKSLGVEIKEYDK